MSTLNGKRLLFLEGENMLIPVLEKAHKLGVYIDLRIICALVV